MMMPMGFDGGMISQFDSQLRRIVVSGALTDSSAAYFLEQISALEFIDISKPITIYINSVGGQVGSALLMYDAIKACSCPITVIAMGVCMSAATLLLAAGEKGSRFISENCRVMIHEVSSGAWGALTELEASVKEIKYLQDCYIRLLSEETGTSEKKILADIKNGDFYMSGQEAIKYGLCDAFVPTRKQIQAAVHEAAKKSTTAGKKSKNENK